MGAVAHELGRETLAFIDISMFHISKQRTDMYWIFYKQVKIIYGARGKVDCMVLANNLVS